MSTDERLARIEEWMKGLDRRIDEALTAQAEFRESSSSVKVNIQRLDEHARAISGAHKAIKEIQEHVASTKGGMKVIYLVLVLCGSGFGAMFGLGVKIILDQNEMLSRHDAQITYLLNQRSQEHK